jgi:hypothetical protein
MTLYATCHCGATRIGLPEHPTQGTECNCTFCARTGAIWAYYEPGKLEFVAQDGEATYSPSGMNHHHFCSTCGMQTWGDSPDWSTIYNDDGTPKDGNPGGMPTARKHQVNLRLVDRLDWSRIAIEKLDGRNSW